MNSDHKISHQHSIANFWFGFALGTTTGAAALYFFGTKKGRQQLKRAMDLTENLEETIADVLGGDGDEYIAEMEGAPVEQPIAVEQTHKKISILRELFNLFRNLTNVKRDVKRFEVKDGKIIS